MPRKVTLLGGGAMATACSVLLAEHAGRAVSLWTRRPEQAAELRATRENTRLLPGIRIPETVDITADAAEAVDGAEVLIAAVPSKFLRDALTQLKAVIPAGVPFVSVIKGIENGTFLRPSEIIADVLGPRPVVALGGPSHAEEFARRLPASVVAACTDVSLAMDVQELFTTDRFRVYTNTDIIGVEMAGALKNVIGIAAGICDGLQYGDNAKASLLTRGIVEITRFGRAFGAERSTFYGLAGMGDLITTCVSPHGRNRYVGERLGRGESLDETLASMASVAEGVTTTKSVYELAAQRRIEMPITTEIYRVLFEGKSPLEATDALMGRPPKGE
jgi:glycerol-3-phosphate dehydrogenase (NAD(P)+)